MAKITAQQVAEIKNLLKFSCASWVFSSSDMNKVYETIKHQFNVATIGDLDEDQYYEVLEYLETVRMQVMKITVILNDLKEHSFRHCLLGGAPLTSIIVRKYRAQLDELPPVVNWAKMVQDLDTAKQAAKAALEAAHV